MGQLIYIEQRDRDEATRLLKGFTNNEQRQKTFINSLGAELIIKYLAQEGINTSNIFNLHNIFRLREEFELADVMLPNIHIDVRMVYDENLLFVPKSHFEYDLVPDIYAVLKTSEDGSYVDFLGFFEPEIIDKTKQNEEYYFVDKSKLQSPDKFISYVRAFNGNTTQDVEIDDSMYKCAMAIADNDVTDNDKKAFISFLKKSSTLREEMIEFDNFEWLSYTLTQEESVDKNFNKTVDEFDTFDAEDEFSMMEDDSEKSDNELQNLGGEDINIENLDQLADLQPLDEIAIDTETVVSEIPEVGAVDMLEVSELPDAEQIMDTEQVLDTATEEITLEDLPDISLSNEENDVEVSDVAVEPDLMDMPESLPEDSVTDETVQEEVSLSDELVDMPTEDSSLDENLMQDNTSAEEEQQQVELVDLSEQPIDDVTVEPDNLSETEQELVDLSEQPTDEVSVESVDISEEPVVSSEGETSQAEEPESFGELGEIADTEQISDELENNVELENVSGLDELLSASESDEAVPSEPVSDYVEVSESIEPPAIEGPVDDVAEISPASYENSTVISNESQVEGEIPIDINMSEENETIEVLYDEKPENQNIIEESATAPEKGKKGILVVAAVAAVLAIGGVAGYFAMTNNKDKIVDDVPPAPENIAPPQQDITENPLPEEAIQPKTQKISKEREDELIAQARSANKKAIESAYIEVKRLGWSVPDYVTYNDAFKNYLQTVGKSLKLALSSDLLSATEYPYSNQINVDLEMSNAGRLLSCKVSKSSGSMQIDNIVLQTVKETIVVVKAPSGVIVGDKIRMTLKIYL